MSNVENGESIVDVARSEIEQVWEAEDHNFKDFRRVLGSAVTLADDYASLYGSLSDLTTPPDTPEIEQLAHLLPLHLVAACRYQLTVGSLAIFRGHLTDSMLFSRRAIEAAGFASSIKKHPQRAHIWRSANDSTESYEKYRRTFATGKLFPSGDTLLKELFQLYDFCSKMLHNSIYGMSGHIQYGPNQVTFQYFERVQDWQRSAYFFHLLNTHHLILQLLADLFRNQLAKEEYCWSVAFNSALAKKAFHQERWKALVPNDRVERFIQLASGIWMRKKSE